MRPLAIPTTGRRAAVRVQQIKNPQTRVGYTCLPDEAQLVLLAAGRIQLRSDEESAPVGAAFTFDAPRLIWHSAGAGTEIVATGGTRATVVSVPALTLVRGLPASPLGEQMRRTLGQRLAFPMDSFGQILALLEGLEIERSKRAAGSDLAQAHYLSLLLLEVWRLARADLIAHGRAPQGLAERFVLLASQHLREHWAVGEYARVLEVSRDRLSSAVRRATGHAPQAYLHQLLIREASELLASTGMPIGQVAFRLGFSDPAYFTRFFTRHRGESPAKFRRTAKARRAEGDTSYAAWP